MSAFHKFPPPRSLDIYRLVVLRQQKQQAVAHSFSVTPSRVCQVITRVRDWVNNSVGDWLFPGRDDLRFFVALEMEQIRLFEHEENPNPVRITGPNFTYTRALQSPATVPSLNAHQNTHHDAHFSPPSLNSAAQSPPAPIATTPSPDTISPDPALLNLGLHIARLLTIWEKSQRVGAAIRINRQRPLPT